MRARQAFMVSSKTRLTQGMKSSFDPHPGPSLFSLWLDVIIERDKSRLTMIVK